MGCFGWYHLGCGVVFGVTPCLRVDTETSTFRTCRRWHHSYALSLILLCGSWALGLTTHFTILIAFAVALARCLEQVAAIRNDAFDLAGKSGKRRFIICWYFYGLPTHETVALVFVSTWLISLVCAYIRGYKRPLSGVIDALISRLQQKKVNIPICFVISSSLVFAGLSYRCWRGIGCIGSGCDFGIIVSAVIQPVGILSRGVIAVYFKNRRSRFTKRFQLRHCFPCSLVYSLLFFVLFLMVMFLALETLGWLTLLFSVPISAQAWLLSGSVSVKTGVCIRNVRFRCRRSIC